MSSQTRGQFQLMHQCHEWILIPPSHHTHLSCTSLQWKNVTTLRLNHALIKVTNNLNMFFCEPPFFLSRTLHSSTLGFVFRQTEAGEHFSLFESQGMALPWCVSLEYLQPIAYIWMSWLDGVERKAGMNLFCGNATTNVTKLEYIKRAAILIHWKCYFFFYQQGE